MIKTAEEHEHSKSEFSSSFILGLGKSVIYVNLKGNSTTDHDRWKIESETVKFDRETLLLHSRKIRFPEDFFIFDCHAYEEEDYGKLRMILTTLPHRQLVTCRPEQTISQNLDLKGTIQSQQL